MQFNEDEFRKKLNNISAEVKRDLLVNKPKEITLILTIEYMMALKAALMDARTIAVFVNDEERIAHYITLQAELDKQCFSQNYIF